MAHVWLRAESKPMEQRTALTPQVAQQLLDSGFQVTVERSPQRAIPSSAYEAVGCTLVDEHSTA